MEHEQPLRELRQFTRINGRRDFYMSTDRTELDHGPALQLQLRTAEYAKYAKAGSAVVSA